MHCHEILVVSSSLFCPVQWETGCRSQDGWRSPGVCACPTASAAQVLIFTLLCFLLGFPALDPSPAKSQACGFSLISASPNPTALGGHHWRLARMGPFVSPMVSKALRHFPSHGSFLCPLLPSPSFLVLKPKCLLYFSCMAVSAIFSGCSRTSQPPPSNLDDFSEQSPFPTVK